MLPFRRHITSVLLLAVFLGGGFFAPLVHRIHHGLTWAEARGEAASSEACDHSRHEAGFEVPVPFVEVEQCPLCLRIVVPFDGPHIGLVAVLGFAAFVPPEHLSPASAPLGRRSIRGPPLAA